MTRPDPRLHAYRPDLADARLRGRVEAQAFAEGRPMQVIDPIVALRRTPHEDSPQVTQGLLGEIVSLYDQSDGWAWVQLQHDGYVGYVEAQSLSAIVAGPTHRVAVPSTFLYPEPNLKTQPAVAVTLDARLNVTGGEGAFAALDDGRYVFAGHLKPVDQFEPDFVAQALKFRDVPYYWGGKSVYGLDCSGLVQLALQSCGRAAPRDSDMQESLGQPIEAGGLGNLGRGDLVFWKGHVGMMTDGLTLLHANGHHMMVVAEPLSEAVDRIAAQGSAITHLRRL